MNCTLAFLAAIVGYAVAPLVWMGAAWVVEWIQDMATRPPTRHDPARNKRQSHKQTTTERGYGWDWQVFARTILKQRPLCEDCTDRGMVTPATEVHHEVKIRDDPSKRLDAEWVKALCDGCHNARTAKGE
jgi:5-methylcytosine-specific restriction endonuclease McrA